MFRRALVFSTIAIALTSTPCFAVFLLDDVMSKDVQQKTGVAKLSANQRIALENWLNQTFEIKTNQEAKEPQLFLSINIDAGQKLQLSDGSLWEVAPADVAQASIWITPFPIRIIPGSDPNYPYLLVNKISGISINARPVSASTGAPTPPAPGPTIIPVQPASPQGTQPAAPTGAPAPQGGQVIPPVETLPPAPTGAPPPQVGQTGS